MRRRTDLWLLSILLVSLSAAPAAAAGPSGRLLALEAGELPAFAGAEAAWRVRVDSDLLERAPSRLLIDTPDGLEFEARKIGFDRRGPGSMTWRGRLADSRESRAILSMEGGALSGWIHTPYGQYEVRPLADGGAAVLRMSNEPLGGCAADHVTGAAPRSEAIVPRRRGRAPVAADSASSIDVLGLFTAQARDRMGGPAGIKSRLRLMVDLTNEAFGNSKMRVRLNLVHTALSPVPELAKLSDNLDPLRESAQVQALRDAHSADLVALVQSTDPNLCGIAYIMDEVSPAFAPYAYSITALRCLTTFAHEVGHNLGMEHDPTNGNPQAQALFPWAFAHFLSGDWRTVMAYPDPCGNCVEVPHFSNPRVQYDGQPTGIVDQRDNARVGDRTGGTIANFRLSGVVHADDFEGGEPSGWRRNRGGLGVLQPGLAGNYLLEVPLENLANRRFLMHRIDGDGKGVDVEFMLKANAVQLDEAEVDLLVLFGRGKAHTKLVLEQDGDAYRVRLLSKGNDGVYVQVANTRLGAQATATWRVEWRAATDSLAADGFVRLAKNGKNRGVLRNFANDRSIVKEVRLGLPSGDVGTAGQGHISIDNYAASVPVDLQ